MVGVNAMRTLLLMRAPELEKKQSTTSLPKTPPRVLVSMVARSVPCSEIMSIEVASVRPLLEAPGGVQHSEQRQRPGLLGLRQITSVVTDRNTSKASSFTCKHWEMRCQTNPLSSNCVPGVGQHRPV